MKNTIMFFAIIFYVITSFNSLCSQTQIGLDILGAADYDQSGFSVSLSSDGSRVAIGAPGSDIGHVRIYDWDGENWVQVGQDINGEEENDDTGNSVSLSSDGNRVAVGAKFNSGNGEAAGHVRIYDWDGENWVQVGEDIDGEEGDWFGFSVSLASEGNKIAIGAYRYGLFNKGRVRVYNWDGENWVQIGEDIEGEEDDQSGWSVSISSDGGKVAIGAPKNENSTGLARVYDWNGGSWVQLGDDIKGEATGDVFGRSISISSNGGRVAIGAPHNKGVGFESGHVRVYDLIGGNWEQIGEDIDGEASHDLSGNSISVSSDGNRIAIGAYRSSGNAIESGRVRIYDWDGENWIKVGEDIEGLEEESQFAYSVSLSSDGERVAIGAPLTDGNGSSLGVVQIYDFTTISTTMPSIKDEIELFPNPTIGKFEILGIEYKAIKILDNYGRIIWETTKSETKLDVFDFAPGIYFIQINSDDKWITKKLIKT